MRKTYLMLLALMLTVLGASDVMGQRIYRGEVDKSMFKAWNGTGADAQEIEPESYVGKNGEAVNFACDVNFYKQLEQGAVVYGNTNVYSRWYANLTGTKTIYFKGTSGTALRVLMNRPDAAEGADDPNGGTSLEKRVEIGADGTGVLDVSDQEYVHLNAIKIAWGSSGRVNGFEIEGTVRPVSGLIDLINNGDAEGTDVESFPVSHNGPTNGDTANDRPEIVAGGVTGNCFKVVSDANATETWSTQFYLKFLEALEEGAKWKLSMWVRADRAQTVTTSAQGEPREWHDNFVDGFDVTTEWQKFEWSGIVTANQAKDGGFLSIAFDLNSDKDNANTFYFDNIQFQLDLGGANPMNDVALNYGMDVIRVDLAGSTNMAELVGDNNTLVFPKDCASVTWNGKPAGLLSVEGRPDGNLYIFLNDIDGDENPEAFLAEDANVLVSFTNPTDVAFHLTFKDGKWAGEDVPNFSGMACTYAFDLTSGDIVSHLWEPAIIEATTPEAGSFNLPADQKEFTVTFNQDVDGSSIKATLGGEALTVAPATGFAKTFTLTRTGSDALSGTKELTITSAVSVKGIDLEAPLTVKYSFGPVAGEGDEPEVLFTDNFGADGQNNYVPAGWVINSDAEDRQPGSYGSGCRVIVGGASVGNGFTNAIAYLCSRGNNGTVPGLATYGTLEENKLHLTARTYTLTAGAARWDANGTERQLTIQVCDANDEVIAEQTKAVEPDYKSSADATLFSIKVDIAAEGDYVLKFIPRDKDGNAGGYGDAVALGNVKLEYIPDVMGIIETKALQDALDKAKEVRDANTDERYQGEDYTALDNLIQEVESKAATMSAPSDYAKTTEDLTNAAQSMRDHRTACDSYDANIKKTCDIVRQTAAEESNGQPNTKRKFMNTQIYADMCALAEKYHATSAWENVGTEEEPSWELKYTYDVLTDNAALAAANEELAPANIVAENTFTEGVSKLRSTGYAAMNERIRTGIATLKALGVAEDDQMLVEAAQTMGDSDEVAEALKNRTKMVLYGLLKGENSLFTPVPQGDDMMDEVIPSYDLSVFVKNFNVYALDHTTDVAGWDKVSGNFYAWSDWNNSHSTSTLYAQDCALHPGWHSKATAEQTITDLPAGVYTLKIRADDNSSDKSEPTYVYAKLSSTPAVEEGAEIDMDVNLAAYAIVNGNSYELKDLVVTDGQLTIGCTWGGTSQAFFDEARVMLTAPATGFDYAAAYTEVETEVETVKTAKVRAIELYTLDGRRVNTARHGIVIVKKIMSDGTVKAEKVVK